MRFPFGSLCVCAVLGIMLLWWSPLTHAGCSDEDYLKAEEIYQKALKEPSPENKIAQFEQAFQICESHGNFAVGYYLLGKLFYDSGQKEKALKWLKEANRFRSAVLFESVNDLAQTNLLLGKLFRDKGEAEKALIHLNIYKALTKVRNKSVDKDFIDNAESLFAVVYAPSSVKAYLSPDAQVAPEYRAMVNRLEVYFDFAHSALTDKAKERLDGIGSALQDKSFKGSSIVVEGHTDEVGGERSNCRLGQRRATAVIDYLNDRWGIKDVALIPMSFGESAPTMSRTERDRKEWPRIDRFNRRVVIWNAGRKDGSFKDIDVRGLVSKSPCSD